MATPRVGACVANCHGGSARMTSNCVSAAKAYQKKLDTVEVALHILDWKQ